MSNTGFIQDFDTSILDHDLPNISLAELEKYCTLICKVAGISEATGEMVRKKTISDYYKTSSFFYRNFHSEHGAMHLPIAQSPKQTHKEKLLFQANTIHEIAAQYNYNKVLELGCGMGFNSCYLAKKNPDKEFTAIDLTPQNLKFANKKAAGLSNITFSVGDFDELSFGDQKFDLIFAIETLCHSKNISLLLSNLKQYLNIGGRIVIFDGYIKENARELTETVELEAYQLMSWGYAMERFQTFNEVVDGINTASLQLHKKEDYGKNVLSNLLAFQKGAKNVLKFAGLLKLLIQWRILPKSLIKQISAGFFSAYFMQTGLLGYYKFELENKAES
jgi:ubiquinone/menaquinone biosynthesis C-methylase UbiE